MISTTGTSHYITVWILLVTLLISCNRVSNASWLSSSTTSRTLSGHSINAFTTSFISNNKLRRLKKKGFISLPCHRHRRHHHQRWLTTTSTTTTSSSTVVLKDCSNGDSLLLSTKAVDNYTTTSTFPKQQIQPGLQDGYFITKRYETPKQFDIKSNNNVSSLVDRLQLTSTNVTLPIALLLIDPIAYPSLSKARRACRRRTILLQQQGYYTASKNTTNNNTINNNNNGNECDNCKNNNIEDSMLRLGLVCDRVITGDVINKQEQILSDETYNYSYPICKKYKKKPTKFHLPIIYEDDYLAIVNKPTNILVYGGDAGGNTIRNALPYFLQYPPAHIIDRLEQPELCHRLDGPTSGLLVVAKTKYAAVQLSKQFEERLIQKTYTTIVNGKLDETSYNDSNNITSTRIVSSKEAYDMGFLDLNRSNSNDVWSYVENIVLDDNNYNNKTAITLWRILKYQKSYDANNQTITLIELKPKTGRYHQLRRLMAWIYKCPIIGDQTYQDNKQNDEVKRWPKRLLLCSNRISFSHPIFKNKNITVSIDLPSKFEAFLAAEGQNFNYQNNLSENE